jgi:FdhE protein
MHATPPVALLRVLDRRLAALRTSRPQLEDALAVQALIIRTQLSSPRAPDVSAFPLPRQEVAARLHDGVPLLHAQPIDIDVHFAADLFGRQLNALAEHEEDVSDGSSSVQLLIAAATSGLLGPEQLFGEAFVGHADHLAQIASGAGVPPDPLAAIATDSVAPLLRAYAARLQPLLVQVDADRVWERGYCAVCGRWPLLAEQRGPEATRWLRCGACGTGWRNQAPACPYCGATDDQALLTVDGESRFNLAVCGRCGGYLKVGRAFDAAPPELLALDDVASLHLDERAAGRGYHRPPGSGYRIELSVPDDEWLEELA